MQKSPLDSIKEMVTSADFKSASMRASVPGLFASGMMLVGLHPVVTYLSASLLFTSLIVKNVASGLKDVTATAADKQKELDSFMFATSVGGLFIFSGSVIAPLVTASMLWSLHSITKIANFFNNKEDNGKKYIPKNVIAGAAVGLVVGGYIANNIAQAIQEAEVKEANNDKKTSFDVKENRSSIAHSFADAMQGRVIENDAEKTIEKTVVLKHQGRSIALTFG